MYTRHDPTSSRTLPPTVRIDGSKIKDIRERQGLTQLYVATAVGVTTDTISRWENRRYPSIKRENAMKLAEALEVDISEILEHEEEQAEEQAEKIGSDKAGPHPGHTASTGRRLRPLPARPSIMLGLAAGFLALGLFLLWLHGRSAGNIVISASRVLPSHSAPGTTFPVLIEVGIMPKGPVSLLVKEKLPKYITALRGNPPYSAGNGEGMLKWIFQGDVNKKLFCYVAAINNKVALGKKLAFNGTVTIRKGATVSVTIDGDAEIETAPFHWADLNRDNVIDDEEILAVYDTFSGLKAVESDLQDLEAIWSAGGYKWDAKHGKFVTLPLKEE